jgi:ElaB/YqjD/DUF883 family membrane-anchored ribosome-binding protein
MNTDNPLNPTPGQSPGTSAASDAERRMKEDAGVLAETAKRDFDKIRGEAEHGLHEIGDQAQQQLHQATDKMKGMAGEQKDALADQLGTVAGAVSRVADELQGEQGAVAGYARSIAGGMERLAGDMRQRDVNELVAMAEDFGRRQPAAFMGVAALAGFAASRFLSASARRNNAASTTRSTEGFGSTSSSYPDGEPIVSRDSLGGELP